VIIETAALWNGAVRVMLRPGAARVPGVRKHGAAIRDGSARRRWLKHERVSPAP